MNEMELETLRAFFACWTTFHEVCKDKDNQTGMRIAAARLNDAASAVRIAQEDHE